MLPISEIGWMVPTVVCVHDRDQNCFRTNGVLHVDRADCAVFVHRQQVIENPFFQKAANFADRRMFNLRSDQVIAAIAQRKCRAFQRHIVRFRAAALRR